MFLRNTVGQGVYFTVDGADGPVAGAAASLACFVSQSGAKFSKSASQATEVANGVYWQPLSQAESDAAALALTWTCSSPGLDVGPVFVYPAPTVMPANVVQMQGKPAASGPLTGTFTLG